MKKCIFIGQAMPRYKNNPHDWPSLNSWLYAIGITDEQIQEHFYYSALVNYFPGSHNGSHRVPTKLEIKKDHTRLINTIKSFNPDIIVPIGRLSISNCLGEKVKALKSYIGKTYKIDPYKALGNEWLVIPLPHPSGASTWRYKKGNKLLLNKALSLSKMYLSSN
jgi:uracil-DNA glycosylase